METVERLCDRVALINRGEKILDGAVSEVKRRYGKNTLVLAYEGDGSFLASLPGVAKVSDFGRYVEIRLQDGADPQALLREAAARLRLRRFEIVEPSLHDIFVETVTGHGEGGGVSAKLWPIVRREYLERVRTKAFVIGTILGPLLMAAMMVGPGARRALEGQAAAHRGGRRGGRAAARGRGGARDARTSDGQARFVVEPGDAGSARRARAAAQAGRAREAARRLPGACLRRRDDGDRRVLRQERHQLIDLRTMERDGRASVLIGRASPAPGSTPGRVKDLTRELDMKTIRVSETGEREDQGAATFLALILLMMLYVSILMWGQAVLTRVIEEKTSRVVEVMASGVPPTTCCSGKLLGVAPRASRSSWSGRCRCSPSRWPRPGRWRRHAARDHAADARLLRGLLPARLLPLRLALRGDRRRP